MMFIICVVFYGHKYDQIISGLNNHSVKQIGSFFSWEEGSSINLINQQFVINFIVEIIHIHKNFKLYKRVKYKKVKVSEFHFHSPEKITLNNSF